MPTAVEVTKEAAPTAVEVNKEKKSTAVEVAKEKKPIVGEKRKGGVIWEEQCPFTNQDVLKAFGEEVHMFMHVHVRGYDRDGDGRAMDASYYDKYGAPIEQENAWMHGYHVIEKELAKHFNQCIDTNTMFPLVAGMAGGAHLYKPVGHDSEPWNWTGWVPRRKVWCTVNTFHKNRHFLNLRGNEIQNNLWDYHPYQEQEKAKEDDEKYEQVVPLDSFKGKGYWLKGQPWARYIHIIGLKSHGVDEETGNVLRYNYIVHPLAYRASINDSPDNHVDGVQWSNLNVRYDGNFADPNKWGTDMHGLEIFNDFTYFFSWCPKVDNGITCNNGTPQNRKENDDPDYTGPYKKEYIYWHDTYPLEFGEFLLDTSYERGVYVHVLAANDAYYMKNLTPDASDSQGKANHEACRNIILADPKGVLIKSHELTRPVNPDTYCTKTKKRIQEMKKSNKKLQEVNQFFETRPYHSDTAFGHIALIDTEKSLLKTMSEMSLSKERNSESEKTESDVMKMLINGKFFAHTGVYDLFKYQKIQTEQVLPFVVHNQPDRTKMCYQLTEEMDLIFDFPRVKANKGHFIWRYSLEYVKDDKTFETVHGYFKMDTMHPTRLNLSDKYEKRSLKWIQFASFNNDNPQRRAWFQAVRGMAFGDPKPNVTPPPRTHKVVLTKDTTIENGSTKMVQYEEDEDFTPFQLKLKNEANNLNFLFPQCTDEEEDNIYVYDMQVCALLPEDNEKTKESYRDPETNDFILPERFVQNVHGYFVLNNDFPTKMNLNYSWDGKTLVDHTISFYCINTSTGQPTLEFPHPTANIPEEYKIEGDRNN